jgi:hypothetical protein
LTLAFDRVEEPSLSRPRTFDRILDRSSVAKLRNDAN